MANKKIAEEVKVLLNANQPSIFADVVKLFRRSDNKILLSFMQQIPGEIPNIEGARILLEDDHAKQLVDIICRNLDYFPTKEKQNPKKKRPVKKIETID